MIGSDSVGVQAGVQEQKFFKNPCKYWPFQGGVGYPRLHLDGGSTTSISTETIVENAREPCVLGLFLCRESQAKQGFQPLALHKVAYQDLLNIPKQAEMK